MRGKTCLVTGANAGIGRATVAGLAAQGARLLMVCRQRGRGEVAIEEIRRSVPGADLDLVLADLSRLHSVHALVGDIESRTDRLDLLVSKAGLFSAHRRVSSSWRRRRTLAGRSTSTTCRASENTGLEGVRAVEARQRGLARGRSRPIVGDQRTTDVSTE